MIPFVTYQRWLEVVFLPFVKAPWREVVPNLLPTRAKLSSRSPMRPASAGFFIVERCEAGPVRLVQAPHRLF
jgi:hypothetical protein